MRFVVNAILALALLFGILLVGARLIEGQGDQRGEIGILFITAAGLILQHRCLSDYFAAIELSLVKRIYQLEEQVKSLHDEREK